MIHHPLILKAKLLLALGAGMVLVALYFMLPAEEFPRAVFITLVSTAALVLLLWIAAFLLLRDPNSPLNRAISHSAQSPAGAGRTDEELVQRQALVGQEGQADSMLRPSGIATIAGERYQVVTEGEFIDAGSRVRVVRVEEIRIVVDAVERGAS